MTRPIKFRAWDSDKSKMVDVYAIDWAGKDDRRPTSINYPQGKLYDAPEDFGGAIKLMQFTGLTDKNGKEIYEGDIVKKDYDKANYQVAWTDDCYGSKLGFDLLDVNGDCHEYYYGGFYPKEVEVIGNIYENPELTQKGE